MTWSLSVSMAFNSAIICISSGFDSLFRYFSSISSSLKTRKPSAYWYDSVCFPLRPIKHVNDWKGSCFLPLKLLCLRWPTQELSGAAVNTARHMRTQAWCTDKGWGKTGKGNKAHREDTIVSSLLGHRAECFSIISRMATMAHQVPEVLPPSQARAALSDRTKCHYVESRHVSEDRSRTVKSTTQRRRQMGAVGLFRKKLLIVFKNVNNKK